MASTLINRNDHPPTVLIVEDDEAFRYAAAHYLKFKGYKVIEAFGSVAAMRELEKGGVDLVVTDVNLQRNEPHGVSLGLMIRHKNPSVPLLLITGRHDLIEVVGDKLPGAVLYKPLDLDVLARRSASCWTDSRS
jgi:DNA-binding response OmpR family regulator